MTLPGEDRRRRGRARSSGRSGRAAIVRGSRRREEAAHRPRLACRGPAAPGRRLRPTRPSAPARSVGSRAVGRAAAPGHAERPIEQGEDAGAAGRRSSGAARGRPRRPAWPHRRRSALVGEQAVERVRERLDVARRHQQAGAVEHLDDAAVRGSRRRARRRSSIRSRSAARPRGRRSRTPRPPTSAPVRAGRRHGRRTGRARAGRAARRARAQPRDVRRVGGERAPDQLDDDVARAHAGDRIEQHVLALPRRQERDAPDHRRPAGRGSAAGAGAGATGHATPLWTTAAGHAGGAQRHRDGFRNRDREVDGGRAEAQQCEAVGAHEHVVREPDARRVEACEAQSPGARSARCTSTTSGGGRQRAGSAAPRATLRSNARRTDPRRRPAPRPPPELQVGDADALDAARASRSTSGPRGHSAPHRPSRVARGLRVRGAARSRRRRRSPTALTARSRGASCAASRRVARRRRAARGRRTPRAACGSGTRTLNSSSWRCASRFACRWAPERRTESARTTASFVDRGEHVDEAPGAQLPAAALALVPVVHRVEPALLARRAPRLLAGDVADVHDRDRAGEHDAVAAFVQLPAQVEVLDVHEPAFVVRAEAFDRGRAHAVHRADRPVDVVDLFVRGVGRAFEPPVLADPTGAQRRRDEPHHARFEHRREPVDRVLQRAVGVEQPRRDEADVGVVAEVVDERAAANRAGTPCPG